MKLEAIERMILKGELIEESSFSENSITERLRQPDPKNPEGSEVSRSSLREELNALAAFGLVQQIPKVGTKIARLSLAERNGIIGTRAYIESYSARYLAFIFGDKDLKNEKPEYIQETLDKINGLFDEMRKSSKDADHLTFFTADLEFHVTICEQAKLETLADWVRSLYLMTFVSTHSRMLFSGNPGMMVKKEGGRIINEHEAIWKSILHAEKNESNDYQAGELIRNHILNAEDNWSQTYELMRKTHLIL